MKPNQKILGAMLRNAFYRTNFPFITLICETYRAYNLQANKIFLERLEKFLLEVRTKILAMVCRNQHLFSSTNLNILNLSRNVPISMMNNTGY